MQIKFYSKQAFSQTFSYEGSAQFHGVPDAHSLVGLARAMCCKPEAMAVIDGVEIIPLTVQAEA